MKSIILAVSLTVAASGSIQATAADDLLDKVISHPGSYSQVCDVMAAPADIPYRAFELTGFSGATFSKKNQELIANNRDELVKAIRTRLLAVDLTKVAKQPGEDPKPAENFDGEAYGCDPSSLNPLILELIQQLHALEALPELLVVEQKLVEGIAKAKNDAKAAPPLVSGWFVGMIGEYDEKESEAKRDRRLQLFQARVAQRDVLMSMALLMREKAHPPYLATTLEQEYAKGLKVLARKHGLPKATPGEPLAAESDGWKINLDPITRVVRREFSPVLIPYSRETRDQIRAAAGKWISENP